MSTRLSAEELDAIEKRANAASEGPWFKEANTVMTASRDYTVVLFGDSAEDDWDADFITAARSDVPSLVAEVRAARAESVRLREALRDLVDALDKYRDAPHLLKSCRAVFDARALLESETP